MSNLHPLDRLLHLRAEVELPAAPARPRGLARGGRCGVAGHLHVGGILPEEGHGVFELRGGSG